MSDAHERCRPTAHTHPTACFFFPWINEAVCGRRAPTRDLLFSPLPVPSEAPIGKMARDFGLFGGGKHRHKGQAPGGRKERQSFVFNRQGNS